MRFRDFVYSFQKYAQTRVGADDSLRVWLSQAYEAATGKPRDVQEDQARTYALIFREGQRQGEKRLELKLIEEFSKIVLSSGGAGVAVEY